MIDLKHAVPTKLLWVDLEMTGLNPQKDSILEIAVEITDINCKPLASYEARVQHPRAIVEQAMASNPFWQQYPKNRDDFLNSLDGAKPEETVVRELVELVKTQFGEEPAILAGNSVHADRSFIDHHWPELAKLLHYRLMDVTSWKVIMQGRYGLEFKKKEVHRAFDDIHESMAELQFYLDYLAQHAAATKESAT